MTETTTETKHNITIEDDGPSRKKLIIEVPAEAVDEKIAGSIDTVAAEAELPGFRKGRAPIRLVEKKFGELIAREAKNELVASAYSEAVEENGLKVIGDPIMDGLEDLTLERGKPLKIEIAVEVMPEFELPSIDGVKVFKPLLEVTDEQIEGELEKLRINEGELEQRDEPEAGDYLTGHGIMTGPDGEEFYNIEGAVVRVPTPEDEGRGMILGIMVEDFADQLGLPKPGETATVKVKGPQHHEREELRGKDLTITFEVERVDRIIPAPLADVVAKLGFESEEEVREMFRTRLGQRVLINQQAAMRQQIARHLLDNTEMELPERLTAAQTERILHRERVEMMYRGFDEAVIEQRLAELRNVSGERAARELKLSFILNKAGDDLDVKVEEAEVNGRIAQMASERGMRPDELRRQLIETRQVGAIVQQIREHKTIDAILAKAEVEEISPEEFEKKFAEG
ncbi:MAG TPA: trigger factor [Phycisphaerales bacterium]|nr:trigger factor [Phycisphaerales bacterium]